MARLIARIFSSSARAEPRETAMGRVSGIVIPHCEEAKSAAAPAVLLQPTRCVNSRRYREAAVSGVRRCTS